MVDYLLKNTPYEIYGGVRRVSVRNNDNIAHINSPRFKLIDLDVTDFANVSGVIEEYRPDYFINFAANSFVGSSWTMPQNHMDTNCMAVLHQLNAIRRYVPHCRYYNAGCYSSDTKIVTLDGLKTIEEVNIGDLVVSLNPKTQAVEYKKITKLIKYHHQGKMLNFKGRGKDILVTPNHNMFYQGKSGLLSRSAEKFAELSHAKYPMPRKFKGVGLPEFIDLTPFIPKKSFSKNIEITSIRALDLMYLMGLYIGDGSSNIMIKNNFASPFDVKNRDSKGRFKKSLFGDKRFVQYKSARITLDIPESDKCFSEVGRVLDQNHISWDIHNEIDMTFFSWGLYHFFDQCGHKSNEKCIPNWVFELDCGYQKRVFDGIMDSDGCEHKNSIEQTSKKLCEQLLVLAANIGLRANYSCRGQDLILIDLFTDRGSEPRVAELSGGVAELSGGRQIIGRHLTYTVHFSDKNICYQKKINTKIYKSDFQYQEIDYDDDVWCLEVEDNHNFLVERNGKTVFCGNSSEEFGDVKYSPQDEKHPLRPRSPYGASKASARHLVKVYRESYKLYAVQGWLFNHESERRGEEFVTRKITLNIARLASAVKERIDFPLKGFLNGIKKPLVIGNIDARRDWSYAPDFIDGIWRMLHQEAYNSQLEGVAYSGGSILLPFEVEKKNCQVLSPLIKDYVLSSGETHSVKTFVKMAFAKLGIYGYWEGGGLGAQFIVEIPQRGERHVLVKVSPDFYRPAEVDLLQGDSGLARIELGWNPKHSFEDLVDIMVRHDFGEV